MQATNGSKQVFVIGTLDTKSEEVAYLEERLRKAGADVYVLDAAPSVWLTEEDAPESRREAMELTAARIREKLTSMHEAGRVGAVIAIGGASGSALATPAMRALPLDVPKVLVSPVASGDTSPLLGTSNIMLIQPVVDFTGLNAYLEWALDVAAETTVTLLKTTKPYPDARASTIGTTAFGVTSPLVDLIARRLEPEGIRQAVFSGGGISGRAFEQFVREGRVFGAFDVTISQLVDELLGGVLSSGPERLTTAARLGVPQVVLPGGLDFINFAALDTVPQHLRSRPIVEHTPEVTLVRTSAEENARLGKVVVERLRQSKGPLTVVVPLQGFSLLSEPGKPFHDPEADRAFLEVVVDGLGADRVVTVDAPINSDEVADTILRVSEPWRRAAAAN